MPGPELEGGVFLYGSCDGYWGEEDRGNEWPGECIWCVERKVENGREPTLEEARRLRAHLAARGPDEKAAEMMLEARERAGGRVVLDPGTLYGTIKKLRFRGPIAETGRRAPSGSGGKRGYYRIAEAGVGALVAEIARMQDAVRTTRTIIGPGG